MSEENATDQPCRDCGSSTRTLEVNGSGGSCLFLPFTPEFEAKLGEDFEYDSEPQWICRFLDGVACDKCGHVELKVHDTAIYLACDGPYLALSSEVCQVCALPCLGPLDIECFGVPARPLAHLAPQYGALLVCRLCRNCDLLWLSLHPDDHVGRQELSARFPVISYCGRCDHGRLRGTHIDVPHAGVGVLSDPSLKSGPYQGATDVAELLVNVCDQCGEVEVRAKWRSVL